MSETKTGVKIPIGWLRLDRGVTTLPGDWIWESSQWIPVCRRSLVPYSDLVIRRVRYAVGENVFVLKTFGYSPDLKPRLATIKKVLATDHRGVHQVELQGTGDGADTTPWHSDSTILAPVFNICAKSGLTPKEWQESDIINKIDPTNDPNVAPYLASETLGGALEEAELTEEPEADHSADAKKMVEMPVVKQSLANPKPATLYIAGPMRGIAWFNYPMFDRIAKQLRDQGCEVISPADEDRKQDGFDPFKNPDYSNPSACQFPSEMDFHITVRRCLDAVLRCDEIVLLPGWERSSGAVAELTLAMWLNKRVRHVRIDDADTVQFVCFWKGLESLAMDLCDEYHPEYVEPGNEIDVDEEEPEAFDDILEEALSITRGSRNASYGPPDQDFRRTAGMWSALFASKLREGVTFEPRDVALAMILLKTSRETHQRKRDNWVDIAGYARCGSLCN